MATLFKEQKTASTLLYRCIGFFSHNMNIFHPSKQYSNIFYCTIQKTSKNLILTAIYQI